MEVNIYVASGFSKNKMGGNKAGVVIDSPDLSTAEKKAIAKQLGYVETAFITESKEADFKFEYFTPKEEVDLCGHATIASFTVLKQLKKLSKSEFTIETKSGILNILLNENTIFMEQAKPKFYDLLSVSELEECFDIEAINKENSIQIVSTGLKDILIPIKSEKELENLTPDFDRIAEVSKRHNVIGMHLYVVEGERIICRNFAPLYDINEEAATGTSNAALASFLFEKRYLEKETYVFEQGYALNSPSEIIVKLSLDANKLIEKVYVGGVGRFCELKTINL